jgi:hypothetical protein
MQPNGFHLIPGTAKYLAVLMFLFAWAGFGIMGAKNEAAARLFVTGILAAVVILLVLVLST